MRLTIDELARRSGTSSRNIRAHQARGLLPPPALEGRTGYYHDEHVRRLQIIADLQERGFSLASIKQILDTWSAGGDLGHLIGFHNALTAPWTEEDPVQLDADELFDRFPEAAGSPELVARAIDEELIVARDDGSFDVPSPLLLTAGEELTRAGVPLGTVLDLVAAVRGDLADVADRFVEVVATHVVRPLTEGRSPRGADEVLETVRRLRPVALEVVRPFLAQELTRAIAASLEEFAADLDLDRDAASGGAGSPPG